jgi:predicted small integral membrane protein
MDNKKRLVAALAKSKCNALGAESKYKVNMVFVTHVVRMQCNATIAETSIMKSLMATCVMSAETRVLLSLT